MWFDSPSRIRICIQESTSTLPNLETKANRQLVYDQHLAHYIEAFIANHIPTSEPRLAAPVSSRSGDEERSTGSSSALPRGLNRLRRRKASQEDEEPLISLEERPAFNDLQEPRLTPPRVSSPNIRPNLTAYDQEEQEQEKPYTELSAKSNDFSGPNIHDDEIKSSIFNLPTASNQSHHEFEERHLQPPSQEAGPSGTFSFLSLSQVSSPEAPAAMLDSMTFSHLASGSDWASSSGQRRSEDGSRRNEDGEEGGDRGDEIMSMPDTGYSTEAFSNLSSPRSGYRSPLSGDSRQTGALASVGIAGRGDERSGGLGLAVEDLGMSFVPLRRQASVVSMSESDGGSDWERISVARST